MQRILRIYVSHFGSPTAWYDHHVFQLDDPQSGEPTDVIFNLENAGGKTSLLSYIFSCFDPKLDRWLQHLQKKNHRFHEYFSRDGRPSFILIEWDMPARSAGAADYKLVIGQAVTIKDTVERGADVDRWFFAYEVVDGLRLEEFPAPGLSAEAMRSMPDFVQWMHQAAKRSGGDFFHTKTQDDWVKHLGTTRLLDTELLRMQVDFNSNEGGMEEGFLTFNSEADLLRRFLLLTLDPEKSATVRDGLAQTADKLKSRPRYEKQLEQLTKLHAVMVPFVDAAAAYQATTEEHVATRRHAASLAAALRRGRDDSNAVAQQRRSYATTQDGIATTARRNAELQAADVIAMKGLQLDRKLSVARSWKSKANEDLATGQKRLHMLNGAKALGHVEALTQAALELKGLMEAEVEGLKPALQQAEIQGALLDSALATAQAGEKQKMAQATAAEAAAQDLLKALAAQESRIQARLREMASERGQLEAFEAAFTRERQRLEQDRLLTPTDASLAAAIARLELLVAELEGQELALGQQAEDLAEQERKHREAAAAQAVKAANASAAQLPLQSLLAKGEALQDELAQMEVLRAAAEADLADPDSTTLLAELDALMAEADREISDRDVRLAQLRSDRGSIVETGLAGRSADVDAAVRQLHAVGVRSARAANTYIADLLPNLQEARDLVLSDPARFLGVVVAKGDWERLGQKLPELKVRLAAPVTVAVATLDAQTPLSEKVVLGPEDSASFNKEAAKAALRLLDARISAMDEERRAYLQRRSEGSAGREKLLRYQREFGAARLKQTAAEVENLQAEESGAKARQRELLDLAEKCLQNRRDVDQQRKPLPSRIQEGKGGCRRLQDFLRDYEEPSSAKRLRLEELRSQADIERDRLKELEGQREEIETRRVGSIQDRLRHENNAKAHAADRDAIAYVDRKYPAEEQLRAKPRALEGLRKTYGDAVALLEAQTRDKVAVLADRLKRAQADKQAADAAFRQDFSDLPLEELEPLRALDFETEVREQTVANTRLEHASKDAGTAYTAAETEHGLYWKGHKQRLAPTPQMQARSDAELAEDVSRAETEAARANQMAEDAQREAGGAREQAGLAETAAGKLDALHASLTAAVPKMGDDYDPLTLPPEPEEYTNGLIRRHGEQKERVDKLRERARGAFQSLVSAALSKDLVEVEAELAREISDSDFDLACSDRGRVLDLINDRMAAAKDTLDGMEPDFQNSVGELYNLTFEGISLLSRACAKTMPVAAPYVGGKPILKMKAKFSGIPVEGRKEAIRKYFSNLIASGVVPAKGADLVAQSLVAITGRQDLGIEVLKMEQNEAHQYQLASELKGSKGQGTVIAMFLYLLISQLRSDTQATAKRAGGGPLILDNPFAKVQTRALIDAQRLLAKEIGVQLVFFTANADYNILAGFRRVVRLRKSHMNSKSQRSHIEMVSAAFEDLTAGELTT